MEPSFIATPYAQASTPSSVEIRTMLDQQEAQYLEWRQARKPVNHPFASRKLNNHFTLAPVDSRLPGSPVEAIRRKFALGSPNASEIPALAFHGKRKDAIQLGLGAHGFLTTSSRKELPRLSSAGTTELPMKSRRSVSIAGHRKSVLESSRSLSLKTKPTDKELKSQTQNRQEEVSTTRSVRVPHAAYKYLKPYLHDYYTRQVFSCAGGVEDGNAIVNNIVSIAEDSDRLEDIEHPSSDTDSNSSEDEPSEGCTSGMAEKVNILVVPGLLLLSSGVYNDIFQNDWQLSGVEKSVRDAVDRRRIADILRGGYRVLLWFFRYYAGNAAVNASATAKGSGSSADRLGNALGAKLFEIPSALRLLEDLNIQCVEATVFGIADTPLKRESIIDFLLGVARMNCMHTTNPARQRVLASDGVELSEAMRALVHDHFGAFSQIQDVNHFRVVFLTRASSNSNGVEALLEEHAINIASFFEEFIPPAAGLSAVNNASPNTSNSGTNTTAPSRQRSAKANHASTGISCAQFVQVLHMLKLITVKNNVASASVISLAAEPASDPQTPGVEVSPSGIEEVRAVRIFLSCLPMEPPTSSKDNMPHTQPQELQRPQFIEALLRVSLAWREREICRGRYDVCPGQLSSSECACHSELMDYSFEHFHSAVEQVLSRIHSHRLSKMQKRASVKMASIRSVRQTRRSRARLSILGSLMGGVPE